MNSHKTHAIGLHPTKIFHVLIIGACSEALDCQDSGASVDLSQRWAHDGTSPAPQPQALAPEPALAAQAGMPVQSLVDAAVSATEARLSLRPIWPLSRKSSGPATPAGAAAIAVSATVASAGTAVAAKVSGAPLLDTMAGTTAVHVSAFVTNAQAVAEQLQSVSESIEARALPSADAGTGLRGGSDGVKIARFPLYISARCYVTSRACISPVLTRRWSRNLVPAAEKEGYQLPSNGCKEIVEEEAHVTFGPTCA